ncbi:hypothetical protein DFH07DRAFT_306263 [Mycena maculata]|uniref:Uncharacterized protein n=1 Tax=Mycena maculata TaxID=230809 RepID=A0AAD7MJH4_9AGAR|nr:hypothetical protein DFH07DRAFT_306263 [Mycena maculata]
MYILHVRGSKKAGHKADHKDGSGTTASSTTQTSTSTANSPPFLILPPETTTLTQTVSESEPPIREGNPSPQTSQPVVQSPITLTFPTPSSSSGTQTSSISGGGGVGPVRPQPAAIYTATSSAGVPTQSLAPTYTFQPSGRPSSPVSSEGGNGKPLPTGAIILIALLSTFFLFGLVLWIVRHKRRNTSYAVAFDTRTSAHLDPVKSGINSPDVGGTRQHLGTQFRGIQPDETGDPEKNAPDTDARPRSHLSELGALSRRFLHLVSPRNSSAMSSTTRYSDARGPGLEIWKNGPRTGGEDTEEPMQSVRASGLSEEPPPGYMA